MTRHMSLNVCDDRELPERLTTAKGMTEVLLQCILKLVFLLSSLAIAN